MSAPGISGKISQPCGTNGTVRQTAAQVIHAARGPARAPREIEDGERREGGDQTQEHHGSRVACEREGGHQQNGQPGRVNRVDLAVLSAAQEVGSQAAAEVTPEVLPGVVVLDPQIAVVQQALRDDQVVRFVAARPDGPRTTAAQEDVDGQAGAEDRASSRLRGQRSSEGRQSGDRGQATPHTAAAAMHQRTGPDRTSRSGNRSGSHGRNGTAQSQSSQTGPALDATRATPSALRRLAAQQHACRACESCQQKAGEDGERRQVRHALRTRSRTTRRCGSKPAQATRRRRGPETHLRRSGRS